jgi:hypothetical protein
MNPAHNARLEIRCFMLAVLPFLSLLSAKVVPNARPSPVQGMR